MKQTFYHIAIAALLMFASCIRDNYDAGHTQEWQGDGTVDTITVAVQGFRGVSTRVESGTLTLDEYDWSDPGKYPYDTPDDLYPKKFDENSLLFISQQSPSLTPGYPTNWNERDKDGRLVNQNIYVYRFQKNPNAEWDNEYNFVAHPDSKPIDWATIRNNGSSGNAFKFYAYYFPGNKPYQPDKTNAGTLSWRTGQWQSIYGDESMINFDVLGAYHASPSLYNRMRFKLYHLMCYVRVTLYVPVAEPVFDGDGEAVGYTGFATNAFEDNDGFGSTKGQPGVYIGSGPPNSGTSKVIAINYNVDYTAIRSSDNEAPLVKPLYETTSSNPAGVNMHLHRELGCDYEQLEDKTKATGASDIFEIDISQFMEVPEGQSNIDRVRRYEFSAYIPPQDEKEMFNKSKNPNKNILYLILKTPVSPPLTGGDATNDGDGTYRKYYFRSGQLQLQDHEVSFTQQGTLQHLYLYVPRTGNETITIKAEVLPWEDTVTDMTVIEEEMTDE